MQNHTAAAMLRASLEQAKMCEVADSECDNSLAPNVSGRHTPLSLTLRPEPRLGEREEPPPFFI